MRKMFWRIRMIKIDNIEVWGFEHAIRGMRNPLNSWDKSDSYNNYTVEYKADGEEIHHPYYRVGAADLALMKKLYKGGSEHRKYLRQIMVSLDIEAPLYWWKEFDTYKVGTVANSCSTMHKIADHKFTFDDFSHDHLNEMTMECLKCTIENLNWYRDLYLKDKNKDDWWQMIQLLPTSFNQKRTITMNYENVITIIKQRTGHKLDEWHTLIDKFKELPYVEEIMGD